MTIQVTGILKDPMDNPLVESVIRVESLDSSSALAYSKSSVETGIDGAYDFNLVNGKFQIEFKQTNRYNKVAWVTVTDSTTTPITLEALVEGYAYCEKQAPTCPM